MTDASVTDTGIINELKSWATAQIKANATVQALLGNPPRLYEDVQDMPTFPYVSNGPVEENAQQADGIDGSEIYVSYDVWSRSGAAQARTVMAALNAVLNLQDGPSVSLPNYELHSISRYKQHVMKDQDGLTTHGVITFRAITDTALIA